MLEPRIKRAERLKYLTSLYNLSGGSPRRAVDHYLAVFAAGLSFDSGEDAFHYLLNEGMVELHSARGKVSLTHKGVKMCELALIGRPQANGYFPSAALKGMHQKSKVAEASPSDDQQLGLPIDDLVNLLKRLKEEAPALNGDPFKERLVASAIRVIESELQSERPRRKPVIRALQRLAGLLTNTFLEQGIRLLLSRLRLQ